MGGLQLQLPSEAQTPEASVQAVPSVAQVVVWQCPPVQCPLVQSVSAPQEVHRPAGGLHWQLPLLLQVPPAVVHSAAEAPQVVVWQSEFWHSPLRQSALALQ